MPAQSLKGRRLLREMATLLGVLFVFALLHVGTRVQVVQTGYLISKLIEREEEMKGDNHALQVEVATLRSPGRLDQVAKQLGLKRPPEQEVTLISARIPQLQ